MCIITVLSNCAYALIAPFLPIELVRIGVPVELFGYIFSMYSVAVIICSPFIGYFLTKVKRRNFVQFGLFSMSIAMFGFALASKVNTNSGFLIMAFITRFVQGFASSSIQTTCFTISGLLYKENQAAVIGYLEMSAGIGMTVAPVIGSILYNLYGYNAPFIFFGSLSLIFSVLVKLFLPYKVDLRGEADEEIFRVRS